MIDQNLAPEGWAASAKTPARSQKSNVERIRPNTLGSNARLELAAAWIGSPEALRRKVEQVSDWGPFELELVTDGLCDPYGVQWIICRFRYHGFEGAREDALANLKAVLDPITTWKPVMELLKPSAEETAHHAQSRAS